MAFKSNQEIAQYRILSKIGEGGMGEVYLAEDTKLERKVALKMLTDACCEDSERLRRFVQEAKAASALNHPNIITIFDFNENDGTHFISTEFIAGKELDKVIKESPLPQQEAIEISIQVVSALKTAHEANIVHRDIKPGNIMLRDDGIVKVLDFGLAKLTETGHRKAGSPQIGEEDKTLIAGSQPLSSGASPDTIPGLVLGTPNYMSPEQARGIEIDHQSDIFSFGIVLFEMLTGTKPFHGETTSDVIAAVLTRDPPKLRTLNAEICAGLESIVEKLLRKSKEERYLSAGALLDELKALQQELQIEHHLQLSGEFGSLSINTSNIPNSDSSKIESENKIAVLPFANMSVEERSDYFSEGLTEEIVVNLSKLRSLKVVPRGSMPKAVDEGRTHRETADILGVRYLLEGSVRRHGDELRISAQLVDTYNQSYLWSETYRGTIKDIFEIQEKVATEIVEALEVTLSPDEAEILRKRFTENTEAYQLYLQGRFFWNKRSIEGLNTAIRYFKNAIDIDSDYALAWAGIADSYSLLAEFGTIPHKELYPKAEAAVKKALELDDSLAEVHTSFASLLLFNKWDWEQSEQEFKRALELNPNYATAHHWYSFWFLGRGELSKATRHISKAAELDPVSQAIIKDKGMIFYYDRRYDEAITLAKHTLELDRDYPAAHRLLSLSYQAKGLYEKAIEENLLWGSLTGNSLEADFCRAQIHAAAGESEEAMAIIKNVEGESSDIDNVYRGLALAYSSLGETQKALDMLEESIRHREISLLSLKVDPKFDSLRSESRFDAVLAELGVN